MAHFETVTSMQRTCNAPFDRTVAAAHLQPMPSAQPTSRLAPRCAAISLAALLLMSPHVGLSQHAEKNRGVTGAIGFGRGTLDQRCSSCTTLPSQFAYGFLLRGGWNLRDNVVLAGESLLWSRSDLVDLETKTVNFSTLSAIAIWYPRHRREYWVKGGVGMSWLSTRVEDTQNGVLPAKATLPTVVAGVGIDLNVARSWSLAPFVDYMLTSSATATRSGAPDVRMRAAMLYFGLALIIH
jgi:hypothetical protein